MRRTRRKVVVCKRGHPQIDENRIAFPSQPGGRCRLCRELTIQEWRDANAAYRKEYEQTRRYDPALRETILARQREQQRRLYQTRRQQRQEQAP